MNSSMRKRWMRFPTATALMLGIAPLGVVGCSAEELAFVQAVTGAEESQKSSNGNSGGNSGSAKVDICHFDEDTGTFQVINISENAVDSHFANHGDSYPAQYFADADGDGYGDAGGATDPCPNAGFVSNSDDCDDSDAALNADDSDGDGASTCAGDCDDSDSSMNLIDGDGDQVTTCAGDCDDGNGNNFPGNDETCDGADDDCDSEVDEGFDADEDGFTSCAGDCDDYDPSSNPAGSESCDGADNNCDGVVDEDVQSTFYADADGDGYGDAAASVEACAAPVGYVSDDTDCNDASAAVSPGIPEDNCGDGLDNDCDGEVDNGCAVVQPPPPAQLAVENSDIEDITSFTSYDSYYGSWNTNIVGWAISGSAGTYEPTSHIIVPASGARIGWINSGGVSQTLTSTLQASTLYNLTVSVGWRTDQPVPSYQVQLLAGGVTLASESATPLVQGGFVDVPVTYSASASDSNLGAPLEIRITKIGGGQLNFDMVRMLASAAP